MCFDFRGEIDFDKRNLFWSSFLVAPLDRFYCMCFDFRGEIDLDKRNQFWSSF